MKFWRPMFIGVLLGAATASIFIPGGKKTRRISARVKRTINFLNGLGEMALRKQG